MARIYKPWFLRAVDCMLNGSKLEREHFYIGRHANGSPAFLPRHSLGEGLYIRGAAGTGKSAAVTALTENISILGDQSLMEADLKSTDPAQLHAVIDGAKLARVPPWVGWFTNRVGYSTKCFNYFEQPHFQQMTPFLKACSVSAALGNAYSIAEYPTGHWGGSANIIALEVFRTVERVRSFYHFCDCIYAVMKQKKSSIPLEIRQAGTQMWQDSYRLAHVEALNVEGNPLGITLTKFFEKPHILFLAIPDPIIGGAMFRLFLTSLFDASNYVIKRIGCTVACDEFQEAISSGLSKILLQARSALNGGGLLLANQCISDLKLMAKDMQPTLYSSCRGFWTFNISDPREQLDFSRGSGTAELAVREKSYVFEDYRWQYRSATDRIEEKPRYSVNDVIRVSSSPRESFLTITQDQPGTFWQYQGFPQLITSDFHITPEAYAERKARGWPAPVPGCIVTTMPTTLIVPPEPEPLPRRIRRA